MRFDIIANLKKLKYETKISKYQVGRNRANKQMQQISTEGV